MMDLFNRMVNLKLFKLIAKNTELIRKVSQGLILKSKF